MIRKLPERHALRLIPWMLPIILATFVFYATASAVGNDPETLYPPIHDGPIAPAFETSAATPQPTAVTTASTSQPDYLLMFLALIFVMTGLLVVTVFQAVTSK